jgi:hypothetical protein
VPIDVEALRQGAFASTSWSPRTSRLDELRRLNEADADSIGFIYCSGHGAAEKGINIIT